MTKGAAKSEMSPSERAAETDRWTEILFRALSNRGAKRWRFVSFRGTVMPEWWRRPLTAAPADDLESRTPLRVQAVDDWTACLVKLTREPANKNPTKVLTCPN